MRARSRVVVTGVLLAMAWASIGLAAEERFARTTFHVSKLGDNSDGRSWATAFTTKFARSDELETWTKLPDAAFGTNRYTACPCVRYVNGYYYVLYLENRWPAHVFETYVTRSKDLKTWELSSANPVLAPMGLDEGINASDPEVAEFGGKTLVYFAVGDQLTWMNVKRGEFPGTLQQFYERWYSQPGIRDRGDMASHRARAAAAKLGGED